MKEKAFFIVFERLSIKGAKTKNSGNKLEEWL